MCHPRWFKVRKTTKSNLIGAKAEEKILFVQEKNIGFIYEDGTFEGPPEAGQAYVKWEFISVHDTPEVKHGDTD